VSPHRQIPFRTAWNSSARFAQMAHSVVDAADSAACNGLLRATPRGRSRRFAPEMDV